MSVNATIEESDVEGIKITVKIPREDLYWLTENQILMFSESRNKPIAVQLRIIFILILELLDRGEKHGKS